MMVGGISQRNMEKVFKKRNGDTYLVNATIEVEPVVEAPADDEDDEEETDEGDEKEDEDDKE
jgi:hypothetical protein